MIVGKGYLGRTIASGNLQNVDTVKIVIFPMRYLREIAIKGGHQCSRYIYYFAVRPGNQYLGIGISFTAQAMNKPFGFRLTKAGVNWHIEMNGGRFNGRQWAEVIVIIA